MEMEMLAGMRNIVGGVLHLQEELVDLGGDQRHVRRLVVLGHALQHQRCERLHRVNEELHNLEFSLAKGRSFSSASSK